MISKAKSNLNLIFEIDNTYFLIDSNRHKNFKTKHDSFPPFFPSDSSQFQRCAKIHKTADFSIPRDESSLNCIPRDTKVNLK